MHYSCIERMKVTSVSVLVSSLLMDIMNLYADITDMLRFAKLALRTPSGCNTRKFIARIFKCCMYYILALSVSCTDIIIHFICKFNEGISIISINS